MWRRCDLHTHTPPNEQCDVAWDPAAFVQSRVDLGLDLIAITDHDHADHVDDAVAASVGTSLVVVAGVELSTDRGHVLALAPGAHGPDTIRGFLARVGALPNHQVKIEDVLAIARTSGRTGGAWAEQLVFIGAHVDQDGAMLASAQPSSVELQLQLASRMHALEVTDDEKHVQWAASGVKQGPKMTLVRGSDAHDPADERLRATWLYLPEISAWAFHHALALRESSVCLLDSAPSPPPYAIESLTFTGGLHDGVRFDFCERANAVIGPPNAGKSLIVDAIKFVFGLESDLDEVEKISASRMAKCLPPGSSVEVVVRTPGGPVPLSRAVGARPPQVPFVPVIFSQTELTRRSSEAAPAIGLLDLHVPDVRQLNDRIDAAANRVTASFESVLNDARIAAELRGSVNNPVDGLAATQRALDDLAGAEDIAKLATATTSTADWREAVRAETVRWRDGWTMGKPTFPQAPVIDDPSAASDLEQFAPGEVVDAAIAESVTATTAAVRAAAETILGMLAEQENDFQAAQVTIEAELAGAGFERGSELENKLGQLRTRLSGLQAEDRQLQALDATINEALVDLRLLHTQVESARDELTSARKQACSRINASMRAFFARVERDAVAAELDRLIESLKIGTFMRSETLQTLRRSLNRMELLEDAVRASQGLQVSSPGSDQARLVEAALARSRQMDLPTIACLWPADALVLAMHGESGSPTPFTELTEGLRALAIKEISFAASDRPVVTDQPEDAVPTRAVFENLVPTLREQRKHRQFIVVSHDANIVVASDVERVTVLHANEDSTPHAGSLFDGRVRSAALEHLEGGRAAFQLRADRYAAMGEQR